MPERKCVRCGKLFEGTFDATLCPDCAATSKSNNVRLRTCKICGKQFLGGPRAWYCPTCREERRREKDREYQRRKRAGKTRKIGSIDYCQNCGKPYTVEGGRQKYCPACAEQMLKAFDRKNGVEYYCKNKDKINEKRYSDRHNAYVKADPVCVICGKPLSKHSCITTCSPECAAELNRQNQKRADDKRRLEQNQKKREKLKQMKESMTVEEWRAYREKENARARENYHK